MWCGVAWYGIRDTGLCIYGVWYGMGWDTGLCIWGVGWDDIRDSIVFGM